MTDRADVERVADKLDLAAQFDFSGNRRTMRDAATFLRSLLARVEQAERERDEARDHAERWRDVAWHDSKQAQVNPPNTGTTMDGKPTLPWEAHP